MKKQWLYAFIIINMSYCTLSTMQTSIVTAMSQQNSETKIRAMFEAIGVMTVDSDSDEDNLTSPKEPDNFSVEQSQKVRDIKMISFQAVTEQLTAVSEELDKFEYEHRKNILNIEDKFTEIKQIIAEKKL